MNYDTYWLSAYAGSNAVKLEKFIARKSCFPHLIKMIEFIALVVLILFVIFLVITFLSYTSLALNLIILIAFYFLIRKDIRDSNNHKYYLISLLLTAIFFVFSSTGFVKGFLILTGRMLLSVAIVSIFMVYLFAHLMAFIYEFYHYLKEEYRR